jgi:anti-sigma factor RsiW
MNREHDCEAIEPLLAPYGESCCAEVLTDEEQALVTAHLAACPACMRAKQACDAARAAVKANAAALTGSAPPRLAARCRAAAARQTPPRRATRWVGWTAGLATAAALAFILVMPAQAVTTQLALDHVKCAKFGIGSALKGTPAELEHAWLNRRAEQVAIPSGVAGSGLRLTGLRRCVSTSGSAAHVMYEQHGTPVSLFILTGAGSLGRATPSELEAAGHKAILWTSGADTYVLVARGIELGATAASMQSEIERRKTED